MGRFARSVIFKRGKAIDRIKPAIKILKRVSDDYQAKRPGIGLTGFKNL
jgi:hypothetical protein